MSWTCPKCNRTFRSAHQWHSCRVVDLDIHMQNVPGEIENTLSYKINFYENKDLSD
jgi:hypothetical protein